MVLFARERSDAQLADDFRDGFGTRLAPALATFRLPGGPEITTQMLADALQVKMKHKNNQDFMQVKMDLTPVLFAGYATQHIHTLNKLLAAALADHGLESTPDHDGLLIPYNHHYEEVQHALASVAQSILRKVKTVEVAKFIGSSGNFDAVWPEELVKAAQGYFSALNKMAGNLEPITALAGDAENDASAQLEKYAKKLKAYQLPADVPKSEAEVFKISLRKDHVFKHVAEMMLGVPRLRSQ